MSFQYDFYKRYQYKKAFTLNHAEFIVKPQNKNKNNGMMPFIYGFVILRNKQERLIFTVIVITKPVVTVYGYEEIFSN